MPPVYPPDSPKPASKRAALCNGQRHRPASGARKQQNTSAPDQSQLRAQVVKPTTARLHVADFIAQNDLRIATLAWSPIAARRCIMPGVTSSRAPPSHVAPAPCAAGDARYRPPVPTDRCARESRHRYVRVVQDVRSAGKMIGLLGRHASSPYSSHPAGRENGTPRRTPD